MQRHGVTWADLKGPDGRLMLYLNSGVDHPLVLVKRAADGLTAGGQIESLIADIKARDIGLVILDPLVELHEAHENDNVEMRQVISKVRDIAVGGHCAVLLPTHTRKPPQASSDGFAGEMDAARGASSQSGVIRVGATLFGMSPKHEKEWKIEPGKTKGDYVRLDIAKNNLAKVSGEPIWFEKCSETIAGESVGVLRPVTLEQVVKADNKPPLLEIIASALKAHPECNGQNFSAIAEKMKKADRRRFPKGDNNARTALATAFSGDMECGTAAGILVREDKGGNVGWIYSLRATPDEDE
jgi:hypothetical protein